MHNLQRYKQIMLRHTHVIHTSVVIVLRLSDLFFTFDLSWNGININISLPSYLHYERNIGVTRCV